MNFKEECLSTSLPGRMSRGFHLLIGHVVPLHFGWEFLMFNQKGAVHVQSEKICCTLNELLLLFTYFWKSDKMK